MIADRTRVAIVTDVKVRIVKTSRIAVATIVGARIRVVAKHGLTLAGSKITCVFFRAGVAVVANLLVWAKLATEFGVAKIGRAWVVVVTGDFLPAALAVLTFVIDGTYVPIVAVFQADLVDAPYDEITNILCALIAIAAANRLADAFGLDAHIKIGAGVTIVAFLCVDAVDAAVLRSA